MNKYHDITNDELHAYVDEQLSADDKSHVLKSIHSKADIKQDACELYTLKNMIRTAYDEPPRPLLQQQQSAGSPRRRPAVVAGFVLLLGCLIGWTGHAQIEALPTVTPTTTASLAGKPISEGRNILVHLTTANPEKLASAIDQIDRLLLSYQQKGSKVRLEIVANGEGLNLLRTKTSPYPERTARLLQHHDNLSILACRNALQHLQEKGIDVKLLPNIGTTDSALDKVVERLEQGWQYIKV